MKTPVRTFDTYYDMTEGSAFSKVRAEGLYQMAAELVGRYAGPIALAQIQGVKLPLEGRPITTKNVRFGRGGYSMLMTNHELVWGNGTSAAGLTDVGYRTQEVAGIFHAIDASYAWTSNSIVSDFHNLTDSALRVATAHEMAHTFIGPHHCADAHCVMQEPVLAGPPNAKLMAQDDPFCDNCIELLVDRGNRALEMAPPKEL